MNGAFDIVNTCRRTCGEHIHERECALNRKWKLAVCLYPRKSDKVWHLGARELRWLTGLCLTKGFIGCMWFLWHYLTGTAALDVSFV